MCGYQVQNILPSGIWIDRGSIDASTSPLFPVAKRGDLYTVSGAGFIGDSDAGAGLKVEVGDLIYCTSDTPGGLYQTVRNNWNSLQTNLDPDDFESASGSGNPILPL